MITVNFTDHMRREPPGAEILRPHGSGDYLFLYFPLPMRFSQGGDPLVTQKHACILLTPAAPHRFSGSPDFVNTFIHFTAPPGEIERLQAPVNQLFYPADFERMNAAALAVKEELLTGGQLHREMVHAAVLQLLVWIRRSFSAASGDPLKAQFEALRYQILSDCAKEAPVERLAAQVCMSRTSFFKYYRQYFGSSPKRDLLKLRMEKAAVLLTNQQKTVAAVAEETGFKSVEHFARYYRKYYGRPPRGK